MPRSSLVSSVLLLDFALSLQVFFRNGSSGAPGGGAVDDVVEVFEGVIDFRGASLPRLEDDRLVQLLLRVECAALGAHLFLGVHGGSLANSSAVAHEDVADDVREPELVGVRRLREISGEGPEVADGGG